MPYTRNTPQATQRISASQPEIQANFQEIDDTIQVDHIQFNDANKGKHKKLTMPVQAGDQPTANNELAFYTKNGANGNPQLFLRRQGSGDVFSFTEYAWNGTTDGWTRLASGILVRFGVRNLSNGAGVKTINLPNTVNGNPAPLFTGNPFLVLVTDKITGAAITPPSTNTAVLNFSADSFDVKVSRSTADTRVQFVVIGQE